MFSRQPALLTSVSRRPATSRFPEKNLQKIEPRFGDEIRDPIRHIAALQLPLWPPVDRVTPTINAWAGALPSPQRRARTALAN
jgi:hypothetical protein